MQPDAAALQLAAKAATAGAAPKESGQDEELPMESASIPVESGAAVRKAQLALISARAGLPETCSAVQLADE